MVGASATVTFLFVDLVGSTDLLHRIGDDANDELTRRYQLAMREAVERHGGEVVRTMGDGLMVVFEHSVAGAASAAIDMHRVIDRMARSDPLLRLQIRIGLSVGEATIVEGDWSGTPIFEAARLESKARPGSILANDVIRVLLGTRGGYDFTPVGALELKGFPEPLPACEIAWEPDPGLPAVPLPSALELGLEWPLVGRTEAVGTLVGAWRHVVETGRASAVAVEGDGGVGKTRLVAELAVRVQAGSGVPAGTVLYGSAAEVDGGSPLVPFAEMLRWWTASASPELLRSVLGDRAPQLAALVPSLAVRLPELTGGAVATEAEPMGELVVDALVAIAALGPLLLIVDDAAGTPSRTRQVIDALATAAAPVLVAVGTTDGVDVGDVAATVVRVDPLVVAEVRELLVHVVERSGLGHVPDEVAQTAAGETGGNPRLLIEAGERLVSSGALGLSAGTARDAAVRRAVSGASPYRGLLAYQAEDADEFFGRDEDVAGLLARLASSRLLAVVGASGSGKSSLVRAGVVPALQRGALAGSAEWPVVLFNAGPRPLLELAAGVARVLDRHVGDCLAAVEGGADGLDGLLRDTLGKGGGGSGRVVIVVDQFEEVFTLCHDDAERERFAAALFHAAGVPGGRALVVLVLRGDFYGHCGELGGLGTAIESSTVLLGPMDETALRQVIEGPARRADLVVEPALTEAMIRDVAGQPGGLPLLSHALLETWQRRRDRTLTLAGYRAAGGAQGAIARTAEAVYAGQLSDWQQRVARDLFLALTELGEGTEDTRRRAPRDELAQRAGSEARLDDVVEVLVAARLITVGEDTVEVAHEAVIREWPRLRDWLDEDREALRALRHLSSSAAEWERGGRDAADLYRGPRLAAAVDVAGRTGSSLTDAERAFLDSSRAAEEDDARRQRRQNQRLRRALVGVGVLLVCALIAGVVAFQQRSEANDQRATADQRTEDADFQRLVSQSVDLAESDPSLAFLLAREANDERDDAASRSALFTTLQRNRSFFGYTPTDGIPTGATLRGDTLVYGTRDGTVGFSDLDSGQPAGDTIAIGEAPDDIVHVFVADDQPAARRDPVVVARADTGEIVRIDPQSHEVAGDSIDAGQPLFALAASARLGLIAAGREDGTVALFDLESGDDAGVLPAQTDPTNVEAPSPVDGANELYGAGDAIIDDGDPIAVAFSPTARQVAVLRPDASVEFWDPTTRRMAAASEGRDVPYAPDFGDVAYAPDGGQLLLSDVAVEDSLMAVDPADGATVWSNDLVFSTSQFSVEYAPTGDSFYTALDGGSVVQYASDDGRTLGGLVDPRLGNLAALAILQDERLIAVSSDSAEAGTWHVGREGPLVLPLAGAFAEHSLPQQIAPDGSSVLIVPPVFGSQGAQVWEPRTGERLVASVDDLLLGGYSGDRTLVGFFADLTAGQYDIDRQGRIPPQIDLSIEGVTVGIINPQAGMVAVGYEDGTVQFYDRTGGQPHPALHTGGAAYIQAISDDGRLVSLVSASDVATIYDTETSEPIADPLRGVSASIFRPDGEALFVARTNGLIEELALPSLERIGEPFPEVQGGGGNMNVSDDGQRLGVVDRSNHHTVFDVATRSLIGDPILLAPPEIVQNGELSPTGDFMVLGRDDGIETWDLDPDHWRDVACRLAGRNLTQDEWDSYLPNAGPYHRTCEEWPAGE